MIEPTPEPWTVWPSIYEGMVAQVRGTGDNDRPIAEVLSGPSGYTDALLMASAPEMRRLLRDAWGALNFILAFYEPGQTYLDTEAWKQAEATGRRVHAALREKLDALK